MATGILVILDDIAMLMDDAAAMSKIATKKTVGLLSDDLAVNAQKASGFASSRELPVLWEITKGSFKNKLIILPIAFLLSAFASWLIIPILMIGGVYLAYEGTEKIVEYFFHKSEDKDVTNQKTIKGDAVTLEKKKIKSAVITDFILSIEIVIMALGTVLEESLSIQIIAVSVVSIIATIGVYGLVALIVRMDDFGFKLISMSNEENALVEKIGRLLVSTLPKLIKVLTVVGTVAMLLVAGGIFVHNVHQIHDLLHGIPSILGELIVGLVVGLITVGLHLIYSKIRGNFESEEKSLS
ncbi:DUF808 family protein [Sulfurimonas aquatica]|uniref:DUF808 family protein n=1 Tax=Sulfurimonas aquatica TaxID=2672570 RepID=A0A975GCH2_9BACT|nr:DUF808 domain-containing protein [Sulfurimonas aquatica]QSZ41274.1 DUF808 family protein [Sulfurimonas aquatica]